MRGPGDNNGENPEGKKKIAEISKKLPGFNEAITNEVGQQQSPELAQENLLPTSTQIVSDLLADLIPDENTTQQQPSTTVSSQRMEQSQQQPQLDTQSTISSSSSRGTHENYEEIQSNSVLGSETSSVFAFNHRRSSNSVWGSETSSLPDSAFDQAFNVGSMPRGQQPQRNVAVDQAKLIAQMKVDYNNRLVQGNDFLLEAMRPNTRELQPEERKRVVEILSDIQKAAKEQKEKDEKLSDRTNITSQKLFQQLKSYLAYESATISSDDYKELKACLRVDNDEDARAVATPLYRAIARNYAEQDLEGYNQGALQQQFDQLDESGKEAYREFRYDLSGTETAKIMDFKNKKFKTTIPDQYSFEQEELARRAGLQAMAEHAKNVAPFKDAIKFTDLLNSLKGIADFAAAKAKFDDLAANQPRYIFQEPEIAKTDNKGNSIMAADGTPIRLWRYSHPDYPNDPKCDIIYEVSGKPGEEKILKTLAGPEASGTWIDEGGVKMVTPGVLPVEVTSFAGKPYVPVLLYDPIDRYPEAQRPEIKKDMDKFREKFANHIQGDIWVESLVKSPVNRAKALAYVKEVEDIEILRSAIIFPDQALFELVGSNRLERLASLKVKFYGKYLDKEIDKKIISVLSDGIKQDNALTQDDLKNVNSLAGDFFDNKISGKQSVTMKGCNPADVFAELQQFLEIPGTEVKEGKEPSYTNLQKIIPNFNPANPKESKSFALHLFRAMDRIDQFAQIKDRPLGGVAPQMKAFLIDIKGEDTGSLIKDDKFIPVPELEEIKGRQNKAIEAFRAREVEKQKKGQEGQQRGVQPNNQPAPVQAQPAQVQQPSPQNPFDEATKIGADLRNSNLTPAPTIVKGNNNRSRE